ncbi:hypothetical protein HI914_02662 [Erysiphe necator]|nr:hypothetical protein HI914_02662 [Erysiphe necator]
MTKSKPRIENIPVFTKEKISIPPHSRMIIPVTTKHGEIIELKAQNKDLVYESVAQESFTTFTHLVSEIFPLIMIQNNLRNTVQIPAKLKVGVIVDADEDNIVQIPEELVYHLTQQSASKSSRIRLLSKGKL